MPDQEEVQTGGKSLSRHQRITRWCLLAILLLSVGAANVYLLWQSSATEAATRGPFSYRDHQVALRLDIAPAHAGTNRFELSLQAADGRPLGRARVRLVLDMPDMAARGMPMPPVVLWPQPSGTGRYLAPGLLAMSGHWDATISATGPGLPARGLQAAFRIVIGSYRRSEKE